MDAFGRTQRKRNQKAAKFDLTGLQPPRPPRGVIPEGPRIIANLMQATQVGYGPGEAPEQFLGGTTSISEWYIYWALEIILGPEGEKWEYQESFMGGRHIPGGSVVDFVVYEVIRNIGLRIQTYYFHLTAGSMKQSHDLEQRIGLEENGLIVYDIYEQDYIHDASGRSAIRVVLEVLGGAERFNPLTVGMVRP